MKVSFNLGLLGLRSPDHFLLLAGINRDTGKRHLDQGRVQVHLEFVDSMVILSHLGLEASVDLRQGKAVHAVVEGELAKRVFGHTTSCFNYTYHRYNPVKVQLVNEQTKVISIARSRILRNPLIVRASQYIILRLIQIKISKSN